MAHLSAFLAVLAFGLSSVSYAAMPPVSIGAVAGVNYSLASFELGATKGQYDWNSGRTFGVTYGYRLLPNLEIELDVLYVRRAFSEATSNNPHTLILNQIELPLLAKFYLYPYFSLGAGFYLSQGVGIIEDLSTTGGRKETSYSGENLSKTDLGLVGSVAMNFPLTPALALIADARYYYGLKNLSTVAGGTAKLMDWQFLGGIKYEFGTAYSAPAQEPAPVAKPATTPAPKRR